MGGKVGFRFINKRLEKGESVSFELTSGTLFISTRRSGICAILWRAMNELTVIQQSFFKANDSSDITTPGIAYVEPGSNNVTVKCNFASGAIFNIFVIG